MRRMAAIVRRGRPEGAHGRAGAVVCEWKVGDGRER